MMDFGEWEVDLGMKRLVMSARRCMASGAVCDRPLAWNLCIMCGYRWNRNPGIVPDKCPSCRSTRWNMADAHVHECLECRHEWVSRSDRPIRCPSCRTKSWYTRPAAGERISRSARQIMDTLARMGDRDSCIAHLMDRTGMDEQDASIIYLANKGVDGISIAKDTGIPYDTVFDVVSEFHAISGGRMQHHRGSTQ